MVPYLTGENGCYFITRGKTNMKYTVIKSYQSEILAANGILKHELIELCGPAGEKYKGRSLRLVHFLDSTTGNEYCFMTNNTGWKASLIANIYKRCSQMEIFFKHLKQRLKVSTFVGMSENAVMIQIWTSLIGILLLKYLQKKAKYDWNLSNLAGFIRMNIFVKINIWKWIDDPFIREPIKGENGQLQLFSG